MNAHDRRSVASGVGAVAVEMRKSKVPVNRSFSCKNPYLVSGLLCVCLAYLFMGYLCAIYLVDIWIGLSDVRCRDAPLSASGLVAGEELVPSLHVLL